jgi:hypothetical protein
VNREQAESSIVDLLCFLTVSARELVNEPKIYGPMRLIEATQQLTRLAADCGIRNQLLEEVSQRIEAFPLDALPEGEEEFNGFMDDLIVLLATWVRRQ